MYKCFHCLNPDYLNNLLKQSSTKCDMRESCRLEQPKIYTFSFGQHSFRYYGSNLWNLLPYSVKNTKDLNVYKIDITRWCHSKQGTSLDVFWNHAQLPLCLYFIRPFTPLSIILVLYMSTLYIQLSFLSVSIHHRECYCELCISPCLTSQVLYPICILSEYWKVLYWWV